MLDGSKEQQRLHDANGGIDFIHRVSSFVDGVAIHSQFDAASGAESEAAARGMKSGQTIAEKVGKETKGVALVVVAGMNYAAYVEAKGYNVLSSAEHLAERELPRMLEKLITNIKRAAE